MRTYTPPKEKSPVTETGIQIDLSTMTREMSEGVPFQLAEEIRTLLDLNKTSFARKLGVDPRTLSRFRKSGRLNALASDRVYRLASLVEAATELHEGDQVRAIRWLKTPNRALGDRRPIDAIASQPDYERAMDLIGALQEGVFV
ncbi:antitoxin Xre/MbcA/ParS toxin-binding domain-containing protein [Oceanithermus sp.]|uniref:antitoxin Xre/MbcA/ParS toxin-binding domain-containing protein n=1 Tax=Oceanithermus sp. TaxID=2268145 RepID=UPI00257CAF56|nr:antitoxin Xre/MbcA/ParS toxin-binding domain-containing protein [Oceanithermus sp.]